jgi:hypothetical protein
MGINLVIPRVSDIFRLSISFHSLEGVSAFKGTGKGLSPTKKLAVSVFFLLPSSFFLLPSF